MLGNPHRKAIHDTIPKIIYPIPGIPCFLQAIARDHGGRLNRAQATAALRSSSGDAGGAEMVDVLWTEMGLAADAAITKVRCLGATWGSPHRIQPYSLYCICVPYSSQLCRFIFTYKGLGSCARCVLCTQHGLRPVNVIWLFCGPHPVPVTVMMPSFWDSVLWQQIRNLFGKVLVGHLNSSHV